MTKKARADHRNDEAYREELEAILSNASKEALAVCNRWHDNFGRPGWGSVEFVRGTIRRAEEAVEALAERESDYVRVGEKLIDSVIDRRVGEELIKRAIDRARWAADRFGPHPNAEFTICRLVEEVGELAQAATSTSKGRDIDRGRRIFEEAVDAVAMVIRLLAEFPEG